MFSGQSNTWLLFAILKQPSHLFVAQMHTYTHICIHIFLPFVGRFADREKLSNQETKIEAMFPGFSGQQSNLYCSILQLHNSNNGHRSLTLLQLYCKMPTTAMKMDTIALISPTWLWSNRCQLCESTLKEKALSRGQRQLNSSETGTLSFKTEIKAYIKESIVAQTSVFCS